MSIIWERYIDLDKQENKFMNYEILFLLRKIIKN